MENNSVTTKSNKKKIIILLTSLFLVLTLGVAGIVVRNFLNHNTVEDAPSEDETPTDYETAPDVVLDENGMPEDGSDIVETETANDADALRKLLLADGKYAIELTKDVRIEETLVVRGTKKLVGNKSIIMELYANPTQSVLNVSKGATLILDGVTIDGNGIANGVTVEKGAGFTSLSGEIVYPVPYGLLVGGTARIKDITIDHSMDIGLCVQEGGNVSMEGGDIIDSVQTGVHVQSSATINISNDVLIDGGQYGLRNRGTSVVTGGIIRNVSGYFVYNVGNLDINYKGADANDKLEWSGAQGTEAGIRIGVGGSANISGLYLRDISGNGIRAVNHNVLNVKNCIVDGTSSYGIASVNGKDTDTIVDVVVRNTQASAIRARGTKKVSIENLTVNKTTGFGIKNENTLVVAKNVTVINSENTGIWGDASSTTEVDGATITGSGKFGVANNSATMKLKNIKIDKPARMGIVSKKQSVTELSNVTITGAAERGIYNLGGEMTATDVVISDTGELAVSTAKSENFAGKVTITNLTVNGVKEKDGLNAYQSVLVVNKATISGVGRHGALASKGGEMKLTNAEIRDCSNRGVCSSGGIIELKNVKVQNTEDCGVTTGKSDSYVGKLTAVNLSVTDTKKNALNCNASVLEVTTGTIDNAQGNGLYAENGGQVTLNNVQMKDCAKRGIWITDKNTKANLTEIKISNMGESGIFLDPGAQAEAKGVSIDTTKSYGVFVKGGNFQVTDLDIVHVVENGLHIDSSKEVGEAIVNITNLTIKDAKDRGVQNKGGNTTLTDVTITDVGTYGATTSKTECGTYVGKLVINNLTLNGTQTKGALNCNASVLEVTKGTIKNIKENGAYVEKGGQLTLENVVISDCEKRGVYANHAGTKVTIKGNQSKITRISSAENAEEYNAIYVDKANLTIDDGTYSNLEATNGAVVHNKKGNVTINGGTFNENKASDRGGVVYNDNGNVTITGGKFSKNEAAGKIGGGVIGCTGGSTLTITGGEFSENKATSDVAREAIYGGGVIESNGVVTISGGTFEKNTAKKGGAVYIDKAGSLSITGGTFGTNETSYRGGAIYLADRDMLSETANATIKNTTFSSNKVIKDSAVSGGAIYVGEKNYLEIEDCTFDNNKAECTTGTEETYGGAVYLINAKVKITNTTAEANTIFSNHAATRGGVIYMAGGSADLTIGEGIYQSNSASKHGGVIFNDAGTVTISGGTFGRTIEDKIYGNSATDRGGVIMNKKTLKISGGEFAFNTAQGTYGGGVIASTGNSLVEITGGQFHDNKAASTTAKEDVYGGGVIESNGTVKISGGTFESNTAQKGGVVYMDEDGTLQITGGTFGSQNKGNSASYRGGVIYIADRENAPATTNVTVQGATFNYNKVTNSAAVSGGVIYIGTKSNAMIENCTFDNNKAEYTGTSTSTYSYGACIYTADSTSNITTVKDTTFTNNQAKIGAAIYSSNGALKVEGCNFSDNAATTSAKDIRCNKGTIELLGKVDAEVALNNTAKILVNTTLSADSSIVIRIINTSSIKDNKTRNVVTFANETLMSENKQYFSLHSTHSSKKLSFADNKATIVSK